ncbi:hypothetical protein [Flavobacterium sp. 3HN19-14]|uniref:hypothetical protein n=1 Tax=Flavobacterium sp. 3HN19-14 TaxID=3448133 RepID=UPI003EE1A8FE
MKKIILAAFLIAGSFATQAQTKFGVKAGVDLAAYKYSTTVAGFTASGTESNTGFSLAVLYR